MFHGLFSTTHGVRVVVATYIGWIVGSIVAYIVSLLLDTFGEKVILALGKCIRRVALWIVTRLTRHMAAVAITYIVASYTQDLLINRYGWVIDEVNNMLIATGVRKITDMIASTALVATFAAYWHTLVDVFRALIHSAYHTYFIPPVNVTAGT